MVTGQFEIVSDYLFIQVKINLDGIEVSFVVVRCRSLALYDIYCIVLTGSSIDISDKNTDIP
jgi:hypothetical protein